ncbi:hypothetical protein Tco_1394093 [Tanacetum coccineum]
MTGQLIVTSKNAVIQDGGWLFLEFNLGRFINGRFNGFSFTEFELFPNFRHIVLIWEGGGGSLFKIALEQDVPSGILLKLDQLQIKLVHLLGKNRICFFIIKKITVPERSGVGRAD